MIEILNYFGVTELVRVLFYEFELVLVLIIVIIAGSGKTFLRYLLGILTINKTTLNMIPSTSKLNNSRPPPRCSSISNYGVAYIYFDHEEQSTHDTTSVLASIVRQLLSQMPVLPDRAGKLHETYNPLKYDSLYNLFLSASSSFTNTFIICDALGECGKGDREQRKPLLTLLCRMAGAANVFLTSRGNTLGDIQNTVDFGAKIEWRAREEDIKIYAEHRVSNSLLVNRLYGKELYRERIVSGMGECAKGTQVPRS